MTELYHELSEKIMANTPLSHATAFAPSNIALCKYWGKRDPIHNLPLTDSISISLGNLGATTSVAIAQRTDTFKLNGIHQGKHSVFSERLTDFLNPFRTEKSPFFMVDSQLNIPYASGLASSACGFAAVTLALNKLLSLNLSKKSLSQLARVGSGSASRSFWHGFVHWHAGSTNDGSDCYASPISHTMETLRIGLLINQNHEKSISSRHAMMQCFSTMKHIKNWQSLTQDVMTSIQDAIASNDFIQLGEASQYHAHTMHDIIEKAVPMAEFNPIQTQQQKAEIAALRRNGHSIFWTQDAGPHLKVIYQSKDENRLRNSFPEIVCINPWSFEDE